MTAEYIVIKIGGVASKQLTPEILAKLSEWQQAGQKVVIVHGGGFAINQLMEENHIPIHKVNGLRVTSQSDMALIKEALVDIVGKNLAGELTTAGLPAYQLLMNCQTLSMLICWIKRLMTLWVRSKTSPIRP